MSNNLNDDFQKLNELKIEETERLNNSHLEIEQSRLNINKIMNDASYNLTTLKIICFTFTYIFLHGYFMNYFSNIISPFKNYYNISDGVLSFISSLQFFGMFLGSVSTNIFLNKMKRKEIIILCNSVILLSTIILCLIHSYVVFGIFRFISSFFLGIYNVISLSIFAEYLPLKFRSFMLNFIWITENMGVIFFLLCCKIFIPNLSFDPNKKNENQSFYAAILPICMVLILNLIFICIFLKDSPRNLLLNNQNEEAKEILEYYLQRELSREDINFLKEEICNSGENKHIKDMKKSAIRILFEKRYLKISILMLIIFFSYYFGFSGMSVALPYILKDISKIKGETLKNNDINSLILFNFIISINSIVGAIIAEIKVTGKKINQIILNFICIILIIFSLIFYMDFNLINSFAAALCSIALNLHISWTEEILPTRLRDSGFGIFTSSSRFGGIISQFLFIPIVQINTYYAILIYMFSLIIVIVCLSFLPKNEIEDLDSELDLDNANE